MTNALKFTSEGSITIDYKIDGNEVKFSVQDTGMGVEPEKQEAIFTRFVKLNSFIPVRDSDCLSAKVSSRNWEGKSVWNRNREEGLAFGSPIQLIKEKSLLNCSVIPH